MRTIDPKKILARFADNVELPEVFTVTVGPDGTAGTPCIVLARSAEDAADLVVAKHVPNAVSIELIRTSLDHGSGVHTMLFHAHSVDFLRAQVLVNAQPLRAIAAKGML